jgi:hypothetical protein
VLHTFCRENKLYFGGIAIYKGWVFYFILENVTCKMGFKYFWWILSYHCLKIITHINTACVVPYACVFFYTGIRVPMSNRDNRLVYVMFSGIY